MNITRDVITDLLPLYTSGEASADTRALVDGYLRTDPEFAALIRRATETMNEPLLVVPSSPALESGEKAALERSRKVLRLRSWTMGLALFFTLLPFSFVHTDTVKFVLIRDEPRMAWLFLAVATCLWIYYSRLNSRVSGTGL